MGRWLVTGTTGQLGGAVAELSQDLDFDIFCPARAEMDLSDPDAIRASMAAKNLDGVINCAAYTAVDKAESDAEIAHAVNASAPAILAEECARRSIPIIHVSTDYVFDGTKQAPYDEDDPVNPLGTYGVTKLAGENAIRASGAQHAIVRTAWLLDPKGRNFLTTMLRLGGERDELQIVSDQIGNPTSVADLAQAVLMIAQQLRDKSGTWHFVNKDEASWFELAAYIFKQAEKFGVRAPQLTPIPTTSYPTPARRPANSRLATHKIKRDFGIEAQSWQHAVDSILAEHFR
ncbi:dTDP-4-dehydrorhamnose reductase [Sphingorhabdus lacus]|uniref:dTDP-4-dehydrorhamnose reductase n=1 Tax=Sphingorhabdus lacus TaxID=392610 RepID=UPI0035942C10